MIRLLLEYPYIVLPLLFLSVIIISLVVTCIVIWDDSEEIVDSYQKNANKAYYKYNLYTITAAHIVELIKIKREEKLEKNVEPHELPKWARGEEDDGSWICEDCGEKNESYIYTCKHCGTDRTE